MGKYTLKNKILAIQEFSGLQNQEGNTLLRSLLSENKIHYQTVVNDANNKFTTQQASMEGRAYHQPRGMLRVNLLITRKY